MASPAPAETLIQRVERTTKRSVRIATSMVDNLEKCLPQEQSPLYNRIPKEIRDLIFTFATEQYEDLDNPYKKNTFYTRPGHRAPHKNSTSLLLTCRRIWLETNHMPMQQAVITFWCEPHRGPTKKSWTLSHHFADHWTKLNKANFRNIHFFMQMHVLRRLFGPWDQMNIALHNTTPETLRITIRHTDWNRWEDPLPLQLDFQPIQRVLDSVHLARLRDFTVELETIEQNKNQLQSIVDQLLLLQGKPRSGFREQDPATVLKPYGAPTWWQWTGSANINDTVEKAHEGLGVLKYQVAEILWKASPVQDHVPYVNAQPIPFRRDETNCRRPVGRRPIDRWGLKKSHGWVPLQFPYDYVVLQREASRTTKSNDNERRRQFKKAMADLEAKKVAEKWKAEGSLLSFDD